MGGYFRSRWRGRCGAEKRGRGEGAARHKTGKRYPWHYPLRQRRPEVSEIRRLSEKIYCYNLSFRKYCGAANGSSTSHLNAPRAAHKKGPSRSRGQSTGSCGLHPAFDAMDARRAWDGTAGREPVLNCGRRFLAYHKLPNVSVGLVPSSNTPPLARPNGGTVPRFLTRTN